MKNAINESEQSVEVVELTDVELEHVAGGEVLAVSTAYRQGILSVYLGSTYANWAYGDR